MIRTPHIRTVRDLYLRSAQWRGRQELFVDETERLSGVAALDASLALAWAFEAAGAGPGTVVAFLCRASARHAASWFGAVLSGRVACNLHVRETAQGLGRTLRWLGATLLVHDAELAGLAQDALAAAGLDLPLVSLGTGWDAALASGRRLDPLGCDPAPGAPAAVILSSGSTGQPKGITHTQATLLETAKGGQFTYGPITPHSTALLYMQPSFAAWAIITLPFVGGKGRTVFGGQFTPDAFLHACERERVTVASLVPTMWRMVFEAGPERYDLSALDLATISGEAPSAGDIARLRAFSRRICCLYLSSEAMTGSAVMADTVDLVADNKVGSSGRPGVGVDLRILDPAAGFDDELADGEAGEIALSGPSVAIGYWNDPELTARRFRDGWWRSGDLGRLDPDGCLWVLGRNDNVINTGGIKVSGEEIELALLSHPGIAQCAVVGQPDARFGRRIEAFCVARAEPPPNEAELDAWLRDRCGLPGFKVPRAVHFLPALPTTATGKLFRRALLTEPTEPA